MAVATAPSVTPAQATSASSSMSPEHAERPLPPVAGCNPAAVSALPVWTRQVMPSPSVPSAFSVITAASGVSRYFAFSGACSSLSSSVFMRKSYGERRPSNRVLDGVVAATRPRRAGRRRELRGELQPVPDRPGRKLPPLQRRALPCRGGAARWRRTAQVRAGDRRHRHRALAARDADLALDRLGERKDVREAEDVGD